ncbi:hypothetical protein B1L11_28600 [Microbispora sp. GKU 823]|nr:LemA family protein [Microbispora sp. GKU 823]OPG08221.1 hypothetical protein B1L11_28600 [Microbispora sp. GKU 823]
MITMIVVLAVVAVLVATLVSVYNRLVRTRNTVDNAWAQIDVQLKRRYDLIPNLVETVKGYAAHERATLEAVVVARAQAIGARGPEEQAAAENMLSGALKSLFAVAEAYPDLKASANFAELQEELAATENRIAYSRQYYNDAVLTYNNAIQTVPANIVAGMTGFTPREYFRRRRGARARAGQVLTMGAWIAAAAATGLWLLLLLALAVATRNPDVEPGPATGELAGQPPAVVDLITGDWRLCDEAPSATLLDLAARGVVAVEEIGPELSLVRLRGEPGDLRPYERLVYDHVRSLAVDGVVATGALAEGSRDLGRWWKSFRKKVIVEARAQGLSRPRWSRAHALLLGVAAAVPAAAIGIAVAADDARANHDGGPGAAIVSFALLVTLMGRLTGSAARPRGPGPPPTGSASASTCGRPGGSPSSPPPRSRSGAATSRTPPRSGSRRGPSGAFLSAPRPTTTGRGPTTAGCGTS